MNTARLTVRAVVVTDGRAGQLPAVLASLVQQELRPDIVHVVLVDGAVAPLIPSELSVAITESDASTYSDAIQSVLAEFPAHSHEYLWLLHDDTAPLPQALASLSATARKRRQAAVIGAAHVRWSDTSKLVNLGTTVTRFGGRRVSMVETDDINQGQYDARDDVLAVSLAAALVRRDVWADLDGLDPGFEGFGESAQFCRRAWMSGYDVVIAPAARIRHSQESLYGRREGSSRGHHSSYGRRRASEWFHAAVWASAWAVPVLVAWMFASSLARSAVRIAQNQVRMVGTELAVPWRVLAKFPELRETRSRSRSTVRVSRDTVRDLLASPFVIFALLRARELSAYERVKAANLPTDVIRADLDRARARRRLGLLTVVIAAVASAIVLFGTWVTSVAAGSQLTSTALGVTEFGWQSLWDRTWSGWSEQGFGAPTLDGSFAALMTPFAVLPGGARLWVGLALSFAVTAAAIGAWFAAGAATRSATVRGLIALTYAVWPMHLQAISDGRFGAVMTHAALPWFALGIARAVGWHRGELVGEAGEFPKRRRSSPSAAVGAAVMMTIITVATPALLIPLIVIIVVLGAWAGKRRWRVWTVPIPAMVVSGPALVAAWQAGPLSGAAWHVLAREPGPSIASPLTQPWELLLGFSGSFTSVPGLDEGGNQAMAMALGAVVLAAAVLALISRRASTAVFIGFLIAALGLLTGVAAQRTAVTLADGAGQTGANGWAGAGSSLALVGLLLAAAVASHGAWRTGSGRSRATRLSLSAVALGMAGLVIAAHVGVSAWPGRAPQSAVAAARADVLPLVAGLEQNAATRQRVLTLATNDAGQIEYSVLSDDGTVWLDGRPERATDGSVIAADGEDLATPSSLADAVATLVGGGTGADVDLAAWGIGVITIAPDSPRLEGALAQITDLNLMGASTRGTAYRVSRPGSDVPVSRAWFEAEDGTVVALDTDGTRSSGAIPESTSGRIVVAVPADPRWHAQGGAESLDPVDDPYGRLAFAVPAGDGAEVIDAVTIQYTDDSYRVWWWAGAVVVLWSLLGAIPIHDRRNMEARG